MRAYLPTYIKYKKQPNFGEIEFKKTLNKRYFLICHAICQHPQTYILKKLQFIGTGTLEDHYLKNCSCPRSEDVRIL